MLCSLSHYLYYWSIHEVNLNTLSPPNIDVVTQLWVLLFLLRAIDTLQQINQ